MSTKVKKKKSLLPDLSKMDILKPLSITDIGSNGDPCFGKAYDLSTKECKMCGDSELCAIVFAQTMNTTRGEIEKEKHFKDMDVLIDIPGVKKYMRKLKRTGYIKKDIITMSMAKFEIAKSDTRDIYRSLNNLKEE